MESSMHLMHSSLFFMASHDVIMHAEHIRGVENGAADALSRDNCWGFFLLVPQARQEPTAPEGGGHRRCLPFVGWGEGGLG